jgi:hypothetical protein
MLTPDRTTIKAAIQELANKLTLNLVADRPTPAKPFRKVVAGDVGAGEYPRPYLALRITRAKPVGVMDDDKLWEVTTVLKVVTDVSAADPHDAILDKIGAVDDYLDSIRDTGVIEGAEGFDVRDWAITYPKTTSGARVAEAVAEQTFIVKVQRQQNRAPAT